MPPERFPPDDPREWLTRARRNLAQARAHISEVYLEDLCFDAQQAAEKAIKALLLQRVLSRPDQRLDVRPGRVVLQSRITLGEPARAYLARVFVDVDRHPAEIVTAYRTSKVARYWQEET